MTTAFSIRMVGCCLLVIGLSIFSGCAARVTGPPSQPTLVPATGPATRPSPLSDAVWVKSVSAMCAIPVGWSAEPLKIKDASIHQVWISPTGATAYGVLVVRNLLMPLASDERIRDEFLKGMKASEGTADLLKTHRDPSLANGIGGLRFVARGGRYTVRAALVSSGTRVWIAYAGTATGQEVRPIELRIAEQAREATVIEPAMHRN